MSTYIYDMVATWTDALTVYDAIKMDVTNTNSASGSTLLNLLLDGTSKTVADKNGRLSALSFGLAASDAANPDTLLVRDAANAFAQRNSTNAQAFQIYNTYTDGSNYERGFARWVSNRFEIGAEGAGTGDPDRTVRITAYSTIQFWNTQYGYQMGAFTSGNFSAGAIIGGSNVGQINQFGLVASTAKKIGFSSPPDGDPTIFWSVGSGTPEGAVTASVGSLFSRTDGSTSTTLYVKTSGTGNTGWTAK